jgi:hypothetical protein
MPSGSPLEAERTERLMFAPLVCVRSGTCLTRLNHALGEEGGNDFEQW